ncbi:MAG: mandelate racemase/muconate lactonizing enzyme family protein [Aquabacterium sp.]
MPPLNLQIARVEAHVFRVPVAVPIKVSFGTFRDRPMVLVRVVDVDGAEGWGEIWSNWPAVGAEHRARLLADYGERLVGRRFDGPAQAWAQLSRELEVLVLQTGEVGPVAQMLAGLDIALWDLVARRAGQPLHRLLGGTGAAEVPVYATGINPDQPERFAADRQAEGHRAFKLKVGFDIDRDTANLVAMREALGPQAAICCDVNQAWGVAQATDFARRIGDLGLMWLEEPIRVDAPAADWAALAAASPVPLAGGENMMGPALDTAVNDRVLKVIQPDVTKWGGISGNLPVARAAVAAGLWYCPHFFGGGLALLASLQLLAAAGGDGYLEFDCHANAGRERIVGDLLPVRDGRVPVPGGAGLGALPDLAALERWRTWPAA